MRPTPGSNSAVRDERRRCCDRMASTSTSAATTSTGSRARTLVVASPGVPPTRRRSRARARPGCRSSARSRSRCTRSRAPLHRHHRHERQVDRHGAHGAPASRPRARRGGGREHRHAAHRGRASRATPGLGRARGIVVPAARHAEHQPGRRRGHEPQRRPPRSLCERRRLLRRQGAALPQRARSGEVGVERRRGSGDAAGGAPPADAAPRRAARAAVRGNGGRGRRGGRCTNRPPRGHVPGFHGAAGRCRVVRPRARPARRVRQSRWRRAERCRSSAITTSRTRCSRCSRSWSPIRSTRRRMRARVWPRRCTASAVCRTDWSSPASTTACTGSTTRRRRTWARRSSRSAACTSRPSCFSAADTRASRTRGSPMTLRRTVKHVIAYGEAAPTIVRGPRPPRANGADGPLVRGGHRARARAGEPGRRRAAVSRLLELRHVQELRGARHARSSSWPPGWRTRKHDRYRADARPLEDGRRGARTRAARPPCCSRSVWPCCTAPARSSRCRTSTASAHYLLRQLSGLGVGVVAFAVAAKIDAERWNKWAWPLMIGTIVLLLVIVCRSRRRSRRASTDRGGSCSAGRFSRRRSGSSR